MSTGRPVKRHATGMAQNHLRLAEERTAHLLPGLPNRTPQQSLALAWLQGLEDVALSTREATGTGSAPSTGEMV